MIISNLNDTICAISTPAGTGGIAVVRLSGTLAIDIADKAWQGKRLADCKSHTAHLGNLTTEAFSTTVWLRFIERHILSPETTSWNSASMDQYGSNGQS